MTQETILSQTLDNVRADLAKYHEGYLKLVQENAYMKSLMTQAYKILSGATWEPSWDEVSGLLLTAAYSARKTVLEHHGVTNAS